MINNVKNNVIPNNYYDSSCDRIRFGLFIGYLSPRKNFTSLEYRIILIVLTAASQIQ